jgi:hypothetical protein
MPNSPDSISLAHRFMHFVLEHWPFFGGGLVILSGYIWWALHQIFATNKTMYECRDKMVEKLDEHEDDEVARQNAFRKENKDEHRELRGDVSDIKNFLMGKTHVNKD